MKTDCKRNGQMVNSIASVAGFRATVDPLATIHNRESFLLSPSLNSSIDTRVPHSNGEMFDELSMPFPPPSHPPMCLSPMYRSSAATTTQRSPTESTTGSNDELLSEIKKATSFASGMQLNDDPAGAIPKNKFLHLITSPGSSSSLPMPCRSPGRDRTARLNSIIQTALATKIPDLDLHLESLIDVVGYSSGTNEAIADHESVWNEIARHWHPPTTDYSAADNNQPPETDLLPLTPEFDGGESDKGLTGSPTAQQMKGKRAPAKGWWKTEICKFWRDGAGCRNGVNCRWAHGDEELRPSAGISLPVGGDEDVGTLNSEMVELMRSAGYRFETTPGSSNPKANSALIQHDHETASGSTIEWMTVSLGHVERGNGGFPHEVRVAALVQQIWDCIRTRYPRLLGLEENIMITANPGIHVNSEYWFGIFYFILKGGRICHLCGSNDVQKQIYGVPLSIISHESVSINTCQHCREIAREKAQAIDLAFNLDSSINHRRRIAAWGLRLSRLLYLCACGGWRLQAECELDILNHSYVQNPLTSHFQLFARICLVLKTHLDSLISSQRLKLFTAQVYESLSLVEWMATAHQPLLFGAFLIVAFPIPKHSLPAPAFRFAHRLHANGWCREYRQARCYHREKDNEEGLSNSQSNSPSNILSTPTTNGGSDQNGGNSTLMNGATRDHYPSHPWNSHAPSPQIESLIKQRRRPDSSFRCA